MAEFAGTAIATVVGRVVDGDTFVVPIGGQEERLLQGRNSSFRRQGWPEGMETLDLVKLGPLMGLTKGNPEVKVAVLDGPIV